MNKAIYYLMLILLIILANAEAYNIDNFINIEAQNITFTGNGSYQWYVNLPYQAYVTDASFKTGNHFSFSHYCYQEFANVTTACGGLNTGTYNANLPSAPDYFFINYTVPSEALISLSKWQIKFRNGTVMTRNLSLANCNQSTKLILKIYDRSDLNKLYLYCLGETDYILITTVTTGSYVAGAGVPSSYLYDGNWSSGAWFESGGATWKGGSSNIDIYEEAVYWAMRKNITEPQITVAGTSVYHAAGNLKNNIKVNYTAPLRSTAYSCSCTNCTYFASTNSCDVPIKWYSNTSGLFEYKSINITYSYMTNISLINETDGTNFSCTKLMACKLYDDYNRTLFDFKSGGTHKVGLLSDTPFRFRVYLQYYENPNQEINRYFYSNLLTSPIRICANHPNITHYAQLLTSSSSSTGTAYLYSPYANCWIVADYTIFSYENVFSLLAYTTNRPYTLYSSQNGQIYELAKLDGGSSNAYNLDNLEFSKNAYNVNYNSASLVLTPHPTINHTLQIYYYNPTRNNRNTQITVINYRTGAVIYDNNIFVDYNEITVNLYLDPATYTNTSLLKVTATATTSSQTNVISRYYTPANGNKSFSSSVGFVLAFLLIFFGLSMFAINLSMSWLGVLICILGLSILGRTVSAWYVSLLGGMIAIIMVFIAIIMLKQNKSTVA